MSVVFPKCKVVFNQVFATPPKIENLPPGARYKIKSRIEDLVFVYVVINNTCTKWVLCKDEQDRYIVAYPQDSNVRAEVVNPVQDGIVTLYSSSYPVEARKTGDAPNA